MKLQDLPQNTPAACGCGPPSPNQARIRPLESSSAINGGHTGRGEAVDQFGALANAVDAVLAANGRLITYLPDVYVAAAREAPLCRRRWYMQTRRVRTPR